MGAIRAGKAAERQLVFLDFYNESNDQEYQYLETSIGDAIYRATVNKYVYSRIDKRVWQRYVQASRFKPADFFDRGKIQTVGNAIPADAIIFGKFTVTEKGVKISARALAVFSREIIAEAEIMIRSSKDVSKEVQSFSESFSRQVAELFVPSDRGAIWRSALLPGWGQVYKGRRTWGHIYGGTVGTGLAFSLFSLIMWQNAYSRYRNYVPEYVITPQGGNELINPTVAQAEFDRYASQTRTWQQITLISAGITLAIYLWQVLDAWIFETDHAKIGRRIGKSEGNTRLFLGAQTGSRPYSEPSGQRQTPSLFLSIGINF